MAQIVAFSGGKDSTALVLRLAELGEDFECLFTPTGNELPTLQAHIESIIALIDRPLVRPPNLSLMFWVQKHQALPNWRQRWCTRQIKIEPCIAYLMEHPGSTLCVGLRADEEERQGLYGSYATYRYPLREWGWTKADVYAYLDTRGITVPPRTDCALCYGQQLGEWYTLWRDYPGEYAKGERLETQMGHTFRSPQRDSWPAPLSELRAKFEQGHIPRDVDLNLSLFDTIQPCRVCRF
jgi:3'-phosphoadenosine 5'-phosphosulfate sulfotransferase (PAPS reductase)/FAD synthetase